MHNETPEIGSRRLFASLSPTVYVNHAAISPPSQPVMRAVSDAVAAFARLGSGHFAAEVTQQSELRAALAQLIGCHGSDIALTTNTSAGVVAVACSIQWKPGDRIIVFQGEFPANVTPWQQAAHRHGLELVWLDADLFRRDPAAGLEHLEAAVQDGARLVAISAVQFQTGAAMPLREIGAICRRSATTELFVDAIQALGSMPFDVTQIGANYVSAGGYKWLMGPEGTGCLYAHPDSVSQWRPELASWLSHEDGLKFLFEGSGHLSYDRPIRQEVQWIERGAANVLGNAGLLASVSLLNKIGVQEIFEHVQTWHDRVESALLCQGWTSARSLHQSGRSAILSVRPPQPCSVNTLVAKAMELGICCASPDGWIRLSPHWPNSLDECAKVAQGLQSAYISLRS